MEQGLQIVKRVDGMFEFKMQGHGGTIPKALCGLYTDEGVARTALRLYRSAFKSKDGVKMPKPKKVAEDTTSGNSEG